MFKILRIAKTPEHVIQLIMTGINEYEVAVIDRVFRDVVNAYSFRTLSDARQEFNNCVPAIKEVK